MKNPLPNLIWLRTFEAAARLLNFTAAGNELGLTQTAVSMHIRLLEARLGCQLFVRQPRNLTLTGMGEAYIPSVRRALEEISLSTNALFGPAEKQMITVKAPIPTAAFILAPRLPAFLASHPNINIRIISRIWADSIADEDVDVNLRIGFGDWPGMQIEKLSTETIVPICAASLINAIQSPKDLLGGNLIHILGYEDNWQRYFSAHGLDAKTANIRYWVDTSVAAFELVVSGGGIATVLTRFANTALQTGRPIAIAGDPIPFPQSHYLTDRVGRGPIRPEVELFKIWLRDCFRTE